MLRQQLLSSVASLALAVSSTVAAAQAPDNHQLYQMFLDLKASQDRLSAESARSRAEAEAARSELAIIRRRLTAAKQALRSYAKAPSAPVIVGRRQTTAAKPIVAGDGRARFVAEAPPLQSFSAASPFPMLMSATYEPRRGSLPAISPPNAKFEGAGGSFGSAAAGYQAAALSVPIADRFGVQFDGLGGEHAKGVFGGGAAHLFTRDPSIGLLGVYGSVAHFDGQLSSFSPHRIIYSARPPPQANSI